MATETIGSQDSPLMSVVEAGEAQRPGPPKAVETMTPPLLPSPQLDRIRVEQEAREQRTAARESKATRAAKFQREQDAFHKLLPELLQTYRDQFVAIHEGQVIGTGPDQIELADRAYGQFGYIPILVTLVTDRPAVVKIPSPRVAASEHSA